MFLTLIFLVFDLNYAKLMKVKNKRSKYRLVDWLVGWLY